MELKAEASIWDIIQPMSDDPVKRTIELLYKPIEGIVKTIAGPAAEEIGLALRDSVRIFRFKRQVRFFKQVEQVCREGSIKPKAVRLPLLLDIIDRASIEDDDEIQDMWANLLVNAADSRHEPPVVAAFLDVLKQLSKVEALFLKHLFVLEEDQRERPIHTRENWRGEKLSVRIRQYPAVTMLEILSLCEQNLVRLGVLEGGGRVGYSLTPFGQAFVKACEAPRKRSQKSQ